MASDRWGFTKYRWHPANVWRVKATARWINASVARLTWKGSHELHGDEPWKQDGWVKHAQLLLDSYHRWLGNDLVPRTGPAIEQSRLLFEAEFVVVSHGTQHDPILNYGNRQALRLWEMDIDTLTRTPSRLTAEPVHRDERRRLLQRTERDGFVDDYQGIRISSTGRRFQISRATVWNLLDADDNHAGQAATFSQWHAL